MVALAPFCRQIASAASVRSLARFHGVSTGTIANRTDRLMRQALVALTALSQRERIAENLCADGFQTFSVSQFFPCDVNLLIGTNSDMVYSFDYALLRRRGRMTRAQREKRRDLDRKVAFEPRSTERSFTRILDKVVSLYTRHLSNTRVLWTDKHHAYKIAWNSHPHVRHLEARGQLAHNTVSSHRARNATNPLRSANYMDREIRKDRADHHRESVCFARNTAAMLSRLAIYFAYRNILKPRRIIGSRSPLPTQTVLESHAHSAGISASTQVQIIVGMVQERYFLTREYLPPFYENLWRKSVPTPLKKKPEYVPAYALS